MTLIWGGRRHAQQGAFRIASGLLDSRSLFVPFKDFVTCDVVERAVGDDMTVFRIVCSHFTRFIHVCVVSSHSFGCLGSFIGCMSCHVNFDFDFLFTSTQFRQFRLPTTRRCRGHTLGGRRESAAAAWTIRVSKRRHRHRQDE